MGSSGTGSFGDLRANGYQEDRCSQPLSDVTLEEVARSDYYQNNGYITPITTTVKIRDTLFNGRIAVETVDTCEVVGLLPSRFSYILACVRKGFTYIGRVKYSVDTPIPTVVVDLDAN